MSYWTTDEAAAAVGLTPSGFRTLAGRARAAGSDLRAPRDEWPAGMRATLYSPEAVRAYVAGRPGRGPRGKRSERNSSAPAGG